MVILLIILALVAPFGIIILAAATYNAAPKQFNLIFGSIHELNRKR